MVATSATEDDHNKDFISLGEFLTLLSQSPEKIHVTTTGRLVLMVILANAFLNLQDGPWQSRAWSKTHICLLKTEDPRRLSLAKPYLSTQCIPRDESRGHEEANEDEASLQLHPYPSILALGILLLEIQLARPIESERAEDHHNNTGRFQVVSDLPEAKRMLEACRDNSSKDFEEAVGACLDESTFIDDFQRNAPFDDLKLRGNIYSRIVKPLENWLKVLSGLSAEQLDNLPSNTRLYYSKSRLQQQRGNSYTALTYATQSVPEHTSLKTSTAAELKGASSQTAAYCVCLYGVENTRGVAEPKHSKGADGWFEELSKRVHPLTQIRQGGGDQPLGYRGVFTRSERIRIAIIDTGISLPEIAHWAYEGRLKGFKSWLMSTAEDQDLNKGDHDLDGHGTHAAALLFKVAPDADVYVARVFKDQNESKGTFEAGMIHQRVADAITYATKEWEVDIITMSFGFEQSVTEIEEAIKLADSRKVVMLAAASNTGQ